MIVSIPQIRYTLTDDGSYLRDDHAAYVAPKDVINATPEIALMRLGYVCSTYRGPYHFLHVAGNRDDGKFELQARRTYNSVTFSVSLKYPFVTAFNNVTTVFDVFEDLLIPETSLRCLNTRFLFTNIISFLAAPNTPYVYRPEPTPLRLWSVPALKKLLATMGYTLTHQDPLLDTTMLVFRQND